MIKLRSVTLHTTAATAVVAPSIAEQIGAFAPNHAAILLRDDPMDGESSWTWSTPKGLWMIAVASHHPGDPDFGSIRVSGPGGSWTFRGGDQSAVVRRVEGVLRALDAIPSAA